VSNAIHFARGIHSLKLVNTEWHVGIPFLQGSTELDLAFISRVWWAVVNAIKDLRDNNNFSVSILEMRLVKGCDMDLSPLKSDQFNSFIAIEVLGHKKFSDNFQKASEYIGTKMTEQKIPYLFHWPKIWPDNDRDNNFQLKFIKSRFPEFKKKMHQIVGSEGVKKYNTQIFASMADPRLNDLLENLWRE